MTPAPILLAHRGDHRAAPENSLKAFAAAVAAGCDGVELDVRASADGEAIVLHDETLDRVQGIRARARDLSAAALAAHGVPRLADVLAALPAGFLVDVELKEGPVTAAVVRAVRDAAGRSASDVVISSFDPEILAAVGDVEPGWERWLISTTAGDLREAARLGCRGLALEWHAFGQDTVAEVRSSGLRAVAWTLRDRASLQHVVGLGVDGVCAEGAALAATFADRSARDSGSRGSAAAERLGRNEPSQAS